MGRICAIIGLVLTLVGTVLAGWALWQDWRAHSGGKPLIPALAKARVWFVRRVLRRAPQTRTVYGHGSLHAHAGVLSASGYASPPSNAPVDVQMRFVRERLLALDARIAKERHELGQRLDQVEAAAQKADADTREAIADVEAKVREVATGSVRMELVGLVLVGLGSIVATAPAVFGW